MSFQNQFNIPAGKIVNTVELTTRMEREGFKEADYLPSEEQVAKIFDNLQNTGEMGTFLDLYEQIGHATYFSDALIVKMTEAAQKSPTFKSAVDAMKTIAAQNKDNGYVLAEPFLGIVSMCFKDQKLVDAFVKTVKECSDAQAEVGKTLHGARETSIAILSKRFNR